MGCASSASSVRETPAEGFHDNYILGPKLGRGAFAQVRVATRVRSKGEEQAVKILVLTKEEEPDQPDKSLQKIAYGEAAIWLKASSHRNVVKMQEVFYDCKCCYFVMEKCVRGLFTHFEQMAEIDERSVGKVLLQMFTGIAHVHSVGVVHRDVKPDNFLVGGDDGLTIKVSDFGLSATLPKEGKVKGVYGTAPYMCPEMLKGKQYDCKADVWSMAVMAFVFLFGDFPYCPKVKSSKGMKMAIVEGKSPVFEPIHPHTGQIRSANAVTFVQQLLDRKPDSRLTASQALELPYLTAVAQNQHALGDHLPSLRPMLYCAKKCGAFEFRDVSKEVDIDDWLKIMQLEKQGKSMDESPLRKICDAVPDNLKKPPSVGSFHSNIWSNTSSLASGWNNTASLATTASGDHTNASPIGSLNTWNNTTSHATTVSTNCSPIGSTTVSTNCSPIGSSSQSVLRKVDS